jgi:hypothetical protein
MKRRADGAVGALMLMGVLLLLVWLLMWQLLLYLWLRLRWLQQLLHEGLLLVWAVFQFTRLRHVGRPLTHFAPEGVS